MLPKPDTLERWAYDYVVSTSLDHKLSPGKAPRDVDASFHTVRLANPGRPSLLQIQTHAKKSPRRGALREASRRAELLHTFLHHELQAAELMCWALLAFPKAPNSFRRGLAQIAEDEIRHMAIYRQHIERLGYGIGDFGVRDWFWERIPNAQSEKEFVASIGIGLEGGNLDHTQRFAKIFREVGDEEGARIQEIVGDEEVPHVRFALHWFEKFSAPPTFEAWLAALPEPMSPMTMRGDPLNRDARMSAGFTDDFMKELVAWKPERTGS